jgi:hypothetical protein
VVELATFRSLVEIRANVPRGPTIEDFAAGIANDIVPALPRRIEVAED